MDGGFYLSGYVLLPEDVMPSKKWLKLFEKWKLEAIIKRYNDKGLAEDLKEYEKLDFKMASHLPEMLLKCDLEDGFKKPPYPFGSLMDLAHLVKKTPELSVWQGHNALTTDRAFAIVTAIAESADAEPRWIYVNMSSYDFWKDAADILKAKY